MSLGEIIGGAAGGLLSGVSSLITAGGQRKENQRARDFQREMWEKQGAREMDYWRLQNEYNLPTAQMERFKDAGLNPNLIYGDLSKTPASLSSGSMPSVPSFKNSAPDFSGVAGSALQSMLLKSQIERTNAETTKIKQSNDSELMDLNAKKALGQSAVTKALEAKTLNLTNQDVKAIREYQDWLSVALQDSGSDFEIDKFGMYPTAGSQFVQKGVKAATEKVVQSVNELKSRVKLQGQQMDINELNKVLLRAEADFTRRFGSKTGAGMLIQLLKIIFK